MTADRPTQSPERQKQMDAIEEYLRQREDPSPEAIGQVRSMTTEMISPRAARRKKRWDQRQLFRPQLPNNEMVHMTLEEFSQEVNRLAIADGFLDRDHEYCHPEDWRDAYARGETPASAWSKEKYSPFRP